MSVQEWQQASRSDPGRTGGKRGEHNTDNGHKLGQPPQIHKQIVYNRDVRRGANVMHSRTREMIQITLEYPVLAKITQGGRLVRFYSLIHACTRSCMDSRMYIKRTLIFDISGHNYRFDAFLSHNSPPSASSVFNLCKYARRSLGLVAATR